MSHPVARVRRVAKARSILTCTACRQQVARWVGRCPGCGAWGTIEASSGVSHAPVLTLADPPAAEDRVPTGISGLDRVLGGGLVPASMTLLAGEPGIGKSTLLLHLLGNLARDGHPCLLVSGEESHAQVRACADALVGLAKELGIAVVMTGHVTKDGDLAGPRTLEHAVDVVLHVEGDARSGLRILAGGKNRFGSEGETAWFEMEAGGLREIDPAAILRSGERLPGAAVALPIVGRRAVAVEIQALIGSPEGPARRHSTGLDPRRFHVLAAVLERAGGIPLGRAELFAASSGGMRIDDPASDLALLAALASAATGLPAPPSTAFVGEVSLTGLVRPAPGMPQRLRAATTGGYDLVVAAEDPGSRPVARVVPVRRVSDALTWAVGATRTRRRAS